MELNQIQEHLESRLDEILEDYLRKSELSYLRGKHAYDYYQLQLNNKFNNAKTYGAFPQILYLTPTSNTTNTNFSATTNTNFPAFQIKLDPNCHGYYGDCSVRFYPKKKPNLMNRFFVNLFFGIKWVDEK